MDRPNELETLLDLQKYLNKRIRKLQKQIDFIDQEILRNIGSKVYFVQKRCIVPDQSLGPGTGKEDNCPE